MRVFSIPPPPTAADRAIAEAARLLVEAAEATLSLAESGPYAPRLRAIAIEARRLETAYRCRDDDGRCDRSGPNSR